MYDHTYCWVQIPHYKSKPQLNSNKYSPNLSINDTPKPRKVINTRERENNKTTLLSMRAQVITLSFPKAKRFSYLSYEKHQLGVGREKSWWRFEEKRANGIGEEISKLGTLYAQFISATPAPMFLSLPSRRPPSSSSILSFLSYLRGCLLCFFFFFFLYSFPAPPFPFL